LREQFLIEEPNDVDIQMSKSILEVKDEYLKYNRQTCLLVKIKGAREKREWLSHSETTDSLLYFVTFAETKKANFDQ